MKNYCHIKLILQGFPRSVNLKTSTIKKVPSKDWTNGFFAGNLWQIYELTGNEDFKKKAKEWTAFIEKEKHNNRTHDMGFKVFCSFGNGLRLEDNQVYKDIIVKSAQTLSTRFNENIGSIRSWDFNKDIWQFPVIIDNMMNLELLFEATKISGDSSYHKLAIKHGNTTLKNHFRPDNSTWHVLDYDTITHQPRLKVTHQGFSNNSAWARGQAWAINGFTMMYRYTKDSKYLEQAKATTDFFINHKNLPEDGIPYWDFNNPSIPNVSKDVSAAAIVVKGYALNEKRLEQKEQEVQLLKNGIQILNRAIEEKATDNQWLTVFAKGLSLLDDYDHEQLDAKGLTTRDAEYPSLEEYQIVINKMLIEFDSDVFGKEKDKSFESSVAQIKKGFGKDDFYPTLEEKAAMLLYLVVKNHSFVDGNKRIAAACFLKFLQQNKMLFNDCLKNLIN